MNTIDDNTLDDTTSGDTTAGAGAHGAAGHTPTDVHTAVVRAEAGTSGWEDAVRLQRWATPDHADFYALAGEIVSTLNALDDLTQVLDRQVIAYGAGRRVYDDTHQVNPYQRLEIAAVALEELRSMTVSAAAWANAFWSAIGHIGVEGTGPSEHTDPTVPGPVTVMGPQVDR